MIHAMISSAILIIFGCFPLAISLEVHVSVTNGNDVIGTGDKKNPFRTIDAARKKVQSMRNSTNNAGDIVVLIHDGTYPSFTLSKEDSGNSIHERTIYRAVANAQVRVSGGIQVPPKLFKSTTQLDNGNIVYTANLSSLKIEFDSFGNIQGGSCIHECAHNRSEVSFADQLLTLARWPNKDESTGHNVYIHANGGGKGLLSVQLTNTTNRLKQWAQEKDGWAHGYWEWDWADCYRKLGKMTVNQETITFEVSPDDVTIKKNARFYGVNLRSELDAAGEYYIELNRTSLTQKLHLIPPTGAGPPGQWNEGPIISLKQSVVDISGTSHISVEGIHVHNGKGVGILADNVTGVTIHNCTIFLHGQQGISLIRSSDSVISNCTVFSTGCAGIRAHGGDATSLTPGNLFVHGNFITDFARWKRTYQAGIHWSGVGNTYSKNIVRGGPHNCFLGGGNEADSSTVAGVDCLFDGNILDGCAYEAADTGAFYVCGQKGTAFSNRNNTIQNCTFMHVRNTVGTGVQTASVQAIYLDDQMSGWNIINNSFIDCQVGSFIGGGRRNKVINNYYEHCDTAQHIDNRGMHWQKDSCDCSEICKPLTCACDPGGAEWMVTKSPAAAEWSQRFPEMTTIRHDHLCIPVHNEIMNNTYCKCGRFIDASSKDTTSWLTVVKNNVEVTSC